jgi:cobalt-zinc-cadmium efflux system outer membrane protein
MRQFTIAVITALVVSGQAFANTPNPEYAAMRHEADAAGERVTRPARCPTRSSAIELMDITRMGEQNATLSPSRVGSTKYTLMQDLPWYGKRDLKREIAELDAEGAQGRARGTWAEIAARSKTAHAQLYYVERNEQLAREILDLMVRWKRSPRCATPGAGHAAGRHPRPGRTDRHAQRPDHAGERSNMLRARINMLLARPPMAPLADPDRAAPDPGAGQARLRDAGRPRARPQPAALCRGARIKSGRKEPRTDLQEPLPGFHARRDRRSSTRARSRNGS